MVNLIRYFQSETKVIITHLAEIQFDAWKVFALLLVIDLFLVKLVKVWIQ